MLPQSASQERDRPLVVARVINYPQIVSTLSLANERSLVEQIVARPESRLGSFTVYQGDEGIFAWTVPAGTAIGHHVEALAALFRSPAKIDGRPFDIAISFGVEIGSGRSADQSAEQRAGRRRRGDAPKACAGSITIRSG